MSTLTTLLPIFCMLALGCAVAPTDTVHIESPSSVVWTSPDAVASFVPASKSFKKKMKKQVKRKLDPRGGTLV